MASITGELSPVNQSAFESNFFRSLNITNQPDFISVINAKVNNLTGRAPDEAPDGTVYYAATVCVKELIIRLLNKQKEIIDPKDFTTISNVEARANNLGEEMSTESASPLQLASYVTGSTVPGVPVGFYPAETPSYSDFLNHFFQVRLGSEGEGRSKKWRDLLSHGFPGDQDQCRITLRNIPQGSTVREYQNICVNGTEGDCTKCYICGLPIKSNDATMECEHIFSFATAISHFGLVKTGEYVGPRFEQTKAEYAWSHSCCNGIKKNFEFMKFESPLYVIDQEAIDSMLSNIKSSTTVKCRELLPKIEIGTNSEIVTRIKPLIDQINADMSTFPSIEYYIAFTTFKLFAAISDDDFLNVIISDVNVTEILKKLNAKEIKDEKKRTREALSLLALEESKRLKDIQDNQRSARAERGRVAIGGAHDSTNAPVAIQSPIGHLNVMDYVKKRPVVREAKAEDFEDELLERIRYLLVEFCKDEKNITKYIITTKYITEIETIFDKNFKNKQSLDSISSLIDEKTSSSSSSPSLPSAPPLPPSAPPLPPLEGGKNDKSRARKTKKTKRTKSKRNNKKNKKSKNKRTRRHK